MSDNVLSQLTQRSVYVASSHSKKSDEIRTAPPTLGWADAMDRMAWEQSEHVTIIGPTGAGKTELITKLLELRSYVVFLGTKNKDSTQDRLRNMGFQFIPGAAGIEPEVHSRYVVKPGHGRKSSADEIIQNHRKVFREALMRVYRQGGWTVVPDELRYICQHLKLTDEMLLLWLQGRSEDISVVSATQRPRYVPLEAYDQPEHLFFFRDADFGNVEREAEIVGLHRKTIIDTVPYLENRDVLYLNTRDGDIFVTNTRR